MSAKAVPICQLTTAPFLSSPKIWPTHAAMVANTLKGIRRTLGTAPAQKAAALTDDIRAMVEVADPGLIGLRDRALIRYKSRLRLRLRKISAA